MQLDLNKKPMKKKAPYNKGDAYEDKVVEIMRERGVLAPGFQRAGAGGGVDAIFIHGGNKYNLEIKADLKADYGQRTFKWSEGGGWTWSKDDPLTRKYTALGALKVANGKKFKPNKFVKNKGELTAEDRHQDQINFEDTSLTTTSDALFKFYELKNCYYMQVGDGYGFYSLRCDPANLGAPPFDTRFTLRLRAKVINSFPIHNYTFYAVLKVLGKPKESPLNIEDVSDTRFPDIEP
ncbi:MAG: hypothetical protein V1676_00335 [Candidatus Diapherotrites archaeon]